MHFPEIHSPIQEIQTTLLKEKKLHLFIKRDDLIHPEISGNKYRKLKYNLLEALKTSHKQVLTFGGAYSNHIAATAAAGKKFGFDTIGVVRGNEFQELNVTLHNAQKNGMKLHFVTREEYQQKNEDVFIENLKTHFGNFHCIPEGGANALAIKGCSEIVDEIKMDFDCIIVPCGTGTTLGGIYTALHKDQKAIGVSVLKRGNTLLKEVENLISTPLDSRVKVITDYHFGGYARIKKELIDFANQFFQQNKVPLDLIYTAKMFYGIFDLIAADYFLPGERIVAIHTGGLQGNKGMCERYKIKLDFC